MTFLYLLSLCVELPLVHCVLLVSISVHTVAMIIHDLAIVVLIGTASVSKSFGAGLSQLRLSSQLFKQLLLFH